MVRNLHILLVLVAAALTPTPLLADEKGNGTPDYKLVIENHRFKPAEIVIPADKKVRLLIENRDDTPEEFDSHDLNREKVMMGNSKATVFIGPLKPGRYMFQGEMHPETAQGVVIVK
jgi:hypothetical protein